MRLSVQIEFDKTLDLTTNKDKVIIGRGKECDLIIPHAGISRKHCAIETKNGQFYITDLGSSNGVCLNGQRLPPHQMCIIAQGQRLTIGNLECEVSNSMVDEITQAPSSTTSGQDFTATIRLARLDLNQPSITLELEKTIKRKGPRNPVTAPPEHPEPIVEMNLINKLFLLLLGLIILAVIWYFLKHSKVF